MPRCFPRNDPDLFIEYPPLSLRSLIFQPPIVYEPYHQMYGWGSGEQFFKWTDWKPTEPFLPGTRLRNTKLPLPGRKKRFLIHQAGPAGMEDSIAPKSQLQEWLESTKAKTGPPKGGAKGGAKGKQKGKGKKGKK